MAKKRSHSIPINRSTTPIPTTLFENDGPIEDEALSLMPEEDKTTTMLIRWLIDNSDIDTDYLSKYLGCKPQSLRNKFYRDSFSIDDFLIAAYACRYDVILKSKTSDTEQLIDISDFFKNKDEVLVRLYELDKERRRSQQEEIEHLKAQLKRLETELQMIK